MGCFCTKYLKFDPNAKDEGIFFVSTQTRKDFKIQRVIENRFTSIIFMINEEIVPGEYLLQIRSRLGCMKTLRTGMLRDTLLID